MGDYSIIAADPPWKFDREIPGGAADQYDVMDLKDIKALRVGDLAAENCALFMWACMPLLKEAFQVMDAWGFRYATTAFVWEKITKRGDPWFGPGTYTGSNVEIVLLGIKGSMKTARDDIYQVIRAPHPRESRLNSQGRRYSAIIHSRKPDVFRQEFVRLFGEDKKRIELFAREAAPGWDLAGNQVPGGGVLLEPGKPIPIIPGPPADAPATHGSRVRMLDLFNWRHHTASPDLDGDRAV